MPTTQKYPNGVNLITYIRGQTGSAQGARHVAEILQYSGIDFTILDFEPTELWEYNDNTWEHKIGKKAIYNINLFHVNPPELPIVLAHVGHEILQDRYNIAFCLWELEKLPENWIPPLNIFDEIWTPSDFTGISFRADTNKPVYTMPYALTTPPCKPSIGREHFMLPADKVLFLCMYDCLSTIGRKNPLGVIEAYKKAFSPKDDNVGLVVKLNNAKQEDLNTIQKHFDKSWNVYIISETLNKEEINSLIKCVDVYVSLHRSEGFGLVCAEAMLLGTPVIATNWSSNTEFMNEDVACMVDYSFTTIKEQSGPYPAGQRWAEPSTKRASKFMTKLYKRSDHRIALAERAKAYVEAKLSPETIAENYRNRISDICKKYDLNRINAQGKDTSFQKWSSNDMSSSKTANIEQIMAEICREIEAKGYRYEDVQFEDIPIRFSPEGDTAPSDTATSYKTAHDLAATINDILGETVPPNIHNTMIQNVLQTSYRPIPSNGSLSGRFKTLIKRIIRKLTFWYIEPVCSYQTEFNKAVLDAITHTMHATDRLKDKVATHMRISAELEHRSAELEHRSAELEHRSAELEHRSAELECVQNFANIRLVEFQEKFEKLNEQNDYIFGQKPKYHWEWGSYSQSGEDMIISFATTALSMPVNGMTYLDLGANHAKTINNTYHFYKQGARGVLVEANPALIPELKFYRHEDVILNNCVAPKSGETVEFYVLGTTYENGDGLSTPDKETALKFVETRSTLEITNTVTVETISVHDIIENYLGKTPTILNIDIEGKEMDILKSIDFNKYRPLFVIIEMIPFTNLYKVGTRNPEIMEFMNSIDYHEYTFTGVNSIFLDKRWLKENDRLDV